MEEDLPEWLETQELGRELFVHDTRTGDVVILNGTARAIWSMRRSGLPQAEIVSFLKERYPRESTQSLTRQVADALAAPEAEQRSTPITVRLHRFGVRNSTECGQRGWVFLERFCSMIKVRNLDPCPAPSASCTNACRRLPSPSWHLWSR